MVCTPASSSTPAASAAATSAGSTPSKPASPMVLQTSGTSTSTNNMSPQPTATSALTRKAIAFGRRDSAGRWFKGFLMALQEVENEAQLRGGPAVADARGLS